MLAAYLVALVAVLGLWSAWFAPWYRRLSLPAWCPSSKVLQWGWTLGLATTGVTFWLISDSEAALAGLAVGLVWAQLVTGLLWSTVFFRRQNARTAFYVMCLHWTAIALAAAAVAALLPAAGGIMLPWLALVTYLGAFNFFVWQLEQRS